MYFTNIKRWDIPITSNTFFLDKSDIIKFFFKIYLERAKGSNPRPSRWQRDALPLSYAACTINVESISFFKIKQEENCINEFNCLYRNLKTFIIIIYEKFSKYNSYFSIKRSNIFSKTNLPLNIFEKRYLDLVNDRTKKNKLMGMVQSQKRGSEVYEVGCLGKISDLQKSKDGRILINLTGITRFKILEEIENKKLYREFKVDYKNFELDLKDV